VVAVTDAVSTRVDPPLDYEFKPGEVLYVYGSHKQIIFLMDYVSQVGTLD